MDLRACLRLWLVLPLLTACGDSSPPRWEPEERGVGLPSCAHADALAAGHLFFTEANDLGGLDLGCGDSAVRGLFRHGESWVHQQSDRPDELALPSPTVGRVLAFGRDVFADLDLHARPPLFTERGSGDAAQPRAVDLPSAHVVEADENWNFEDLCFSGRGVFPLFPAGLASPMAFQLLPQVGDGAALLAQGCGRVELFQFSAGTATPTQRTIAAEKPKSALAIALPIQAFADVNTSHSREHAQVVVATWAPGHWIDDHASDRLLLSTFPPEREPHEITFPHGLRGPKAFRACGSYALIAGNSERPLPGGPQPNDSDENDLWVARIDLSTMTLEREVTLDVDGDDFAFAIACDPLSGEIVVGGTTGRHFVDSGSWDGGGRALLLRMSPALDVQEQIEFGGDRLTVIEHVRLGREHMVVGGIWEGVPNNHLPEGELWARAFVAVLPRSGWRAPTAQPFTSLRALEP